MTAAHFPLPTLDRWTALARKALKDAPLEGLSRTDGDGLEIASLYVDGGAPVLSAPRPSRVEGRAWDLRVLVEAEAPVQTNAAILDELNGGAASAVLTGAALADPDVLSRALEGVALELAPIGLDAGVQGALAAGALAVAAKGSPRARLMLHLDPVSAFARDGGAPRAIETEVAQAAATAARHAQPYPAATLFLASGRAAHEAGGTIGQELGFALASAADWLRAGTEAGLSVERTLAGTVLGLSVDAEYLDGVAKLRAARLMWRAFARAAGVETAAIIEARSSGRMLGARDPWPNLLRLTAAGFAGAVGGADAVILDGFTAAVGAPDAFARRLARNTQLVLMEEAHLGRVDDPAAGSWFLDARTRDLAQAGWAEFQRIETEGGLVAALKAGTIQSRVAQARSAREAAYAEGGAVLIGVNRFVDPEPRPATAAPREPAAPSPGDACVPLTPVRWAEAFEGTGA
ncbi:methylmalonyl-CoA mutase family protein [Brevundimonas sp.]|uniref:methylmalonyl-CoA mutase family protein n=1 Tax=Brevundimonas sp. TaxID=1871086 RepID=UPI002FD9A33C